MKLRSALVWCLACRSSQQPLVFKAGVQEKEGKWYKLDASAAIELILKLHPEEREMISVWSIQYKFILCLNIYTVYVWGLYWPVESESMKEGWKSLHHQQDGHSEDSKQTKNRHQEHNAYTGVHTQTDPHHHRPQHFRELWTTTKHVQQTLILNKAVFKSNSRPIIVKNNNLQVLYRLNISPRISAVIMIKRLVSNWIA